MEITDHYSELIKPVRQEVANDYRKRQEAEIMNHLCRIKLNAKRLLGIDLPDGFKAIYFINDYGGRTQIEFDGDGKDLELEIDGDNVHYLKVDYGKSSDEDIYDEDEFPISNSDKTLELLDWVKG